MGQHCETCKCGDSPEVAEASEPTPAISLTIDGKAIVTALRDYERQSGQRILL